MARSVSGAPSTVKGHPKILSNRSAESIFGTRPHSARSVRISAISA